MKKINFFVVFLCIFIGKSFSQTVDFTVKISNVVINGGKVYLRVFSNAGEFSREEPYISFELEDTNAVLSQNISLIYGEYVIAAFQDSNGNGVVDYGLFGVPKELVGVSNYFGRGIPSKIFDRQKVFINSSTGIITIGLYKF